MPKMFARIGKLEEERDPIGGVSVHRKCPDITLQSPEIQSNFSKIRHYLPQEIRKQNYNKVRDRIFNDKGPKFYSDNNIEQKGSLEKTNYDSTSLGNRKLEYILKVRNDFIARKKQRQIIAESINKCISEYDPRPYANILLEGKPFKGLLDSGATVCLLGKNCREIIEELGAKITGIFCKVRTATGQPHIVLGKSELEVEYAELDNMLKLNVIEESDSPWSNRTTVVRKPGKNRFCLDARKLNAVTIKDAYPLQNIDGILSRIDQTHYISSVDLKYAFWQIELEETAKPYTAFTVSGRPLYQFRVMPFGLCNAAQRLCRLMDKVIPARLRTNVFIYLDDLLIISDTFASHLRILEEVAKCLEQSNLTIGLKKSMFCFRELRYLGFIIGGLIQKKWRLFKKYLCRNRQEKFEAF